MKFYTFVDEPIYKNYDFHDGEKHYESVYRHYLAIEETKELIPFFEDKAYFFSFENLIDMHNRKYDTLNRFKEYYFYSFMAYPIWNMKKNITQSYLNSFLSKMILIKKDTSPTIDKIFAHETLIKHLFSFSHSYYSEEIVPWNILAEHSLNNNENGILAICTDIKAWFLSDKKWEQYDWSPIAQGMHFVIKIHIYLLFDSGQNVCLELKITDCSNMKKMLNNSLKPTNYYCSEGFCITKAARVINDRILFCLAGGSVEEILLKIINYSCLKIINYNCNSLYKAKIGNQNGVEVSFGGFLEKDKFLLGYRLSEPVYEYTGGGVNPWAIGYYNPYRKLDESNNTDKDIFIENNIIYNKFAEMFGWEKE